MWRDQRRDSVISSRTKQPQSVAVLMSVSVSLGSGAEALRCEPSGYSAVIQNRQSAEWEGPPLGAFPWEQPLG